MTTLVGMKIHVALFYIDLERTYATPRFLSRVPFSSRPLWLQAGMGRSRANQTCTARHSSHRSRLGMDVFESPAVLHVLPHVVLLLRVLLLNESYARNS